jgi:hypothetical protein
VEFAECVTYCNTQNDLLTQYGWKYSDAGVGVFLDLESSDINLD